MSEPIRVLHFADVHLGAENYGAADPETGVSARVSDSLLRLDEMIEFARAGDVDLALFAGDAFHSRGPNPTVQREFAVRMLALSRLAPLVMLLGDSDSPPQSTRASSLAIYDTLRVPNIWVAQDYQARRIATKRGDVVLGAAPYLSRSRLLADADARGRSREEEAAEAERSLRERLDALAAEADELAADDAPRLLCGHFSVAGAEPESDGDAPLGPDAAVALDSLADTGWDYVALGHRRRHQALSAAEPPVVYSGGLERIGFAEADEATGFCWVELARGAADWRFVELAARKMLALRVDCRDVENPTVAVLDELRRHDLAGVVLRLDIRLGAETEAMLKDKVIRDALRRAGVFHIAAISKDVERPIRTRLGANPEGLSELELLERYFEVRAVEPGRREQLLRLAREIVAGE
ncbi:MAG: exonuclease SbcCD subunit D [Chloroflexi bacterium]|nr:exonuclease SbcCD subunit D [Chloroflexota bacterium]